MGLRISIPRIQLSSENASDVTSLWGASVQEARQRRRVTQPEEATVALIPPKVIARLPSSLRTPMAYLSWEWILRAGGQVSYRLTAVDGHRERNPWKPAGHLPPSDMPALLRSQIRARRVLADLARQQGHQVSTRR